jgi:hypothetical protein
MFKKKTEAQYLSQIMVEISEMEVHCFDKVDDEYILAYRRGDTKVIRIFDMLIRN